MSDSNDAILNHNTELRSKPTTKGTVVQVLLNGKRVAVITKQGRWVKVKTADKNGWVLSKYLKRTKPIRFSQAGHQQSGRPNFQPDRIQRGMPVDVYLPDADPANEKQQIEEIKNSVTNFLKQFGFTPDPDVRPNESVDSWRWLNWFKPTPELKQEATEIYDEMKEALRRKHIDVEGATAYEKRANATANLLKSIEPYENAIMRLGDVVVAKSTIDGTPLLLVETVSPKLARELEKQPGILNDPKKFMNFIETQNTMPLIEYDKD